LTSSSLDQPDCFTTIPRRKGTVNGALDKDSYKALLRLCGAHEHRKELEQTLRTLRDRSSHYIDDGELSSLETYAKRMRGEIFFARRWLLVEGQADYLIAHAVGYAMDYDLDAHGVSVIDVQNNGNPDSFAALARALGIPWLAVFDGDDAGHKYIQNIGRRGFTEDVLGRQCHTHESGDLEAQLVADGLGSELRQILVELGHRNVPDMIDDALPQPLRSNKTACAAKLAARFRADKSLAQRAPAAFRTAISQLPELA